MKTFRIIGGDLSIGDDGRPEMVNGDRKLTQDVLEFLLVKKNRDGYGAGLADLVGSVTGGFVPSAIALRVLNAASYYQSLQATQPDVPPSEQLIQVVDVRSGRAQGGRRGDFAFTVLIKNGKDPSPRPISLLHRPPLNQR